MSHQGLFFGSSGRSLGTTGAVLFRGTVGHLAEKIKHDDLLVVLSDGGLFVWKCIFIDI